MHGHATPLRKGNGLTCTEKEQTDELCLYNCRMSDRVRGSQSLTIPSRPPEISAKLAISMPHTEPSCAFQDTMSSLHPRSHW